MKSIRNVLALLSLLAGTAVALKALVGIAWPALTWALVLGAGQVFLGLFLAAAAFVAALFATIVLYQPPKEGK